MKKFITLGPGRAGYVRIDVYWKYQNLMSWLKGSLLMTMIIITGKNSVDQHEMPPLAASHQGLHCLLKPPFKNAMLKLVHAKLFVVARCRVFVKSVIVIIYNSDGSSVAARWFRSLYLCPKLQ